MSTERLLLLKGVRSELKEDGIAIQEQAFVHQSEIASSCYSCMAPPHDIPIRTIPYKDVLYCKPLDNELCHLTFVVEQGNSIGVQEINIAVNSPVKDSKPPNICAQINEKAYPQSQITPSILVLINPKGGQGKALKIYNDQIAPLLLAANAKVDVQETKYHGHGRDIVKDLDILKYDIICCCSGDGIPHEVINGFNQRPDKVEAFNKIAITQLPCGSGNALSLSTHGTNDALVATVRMLKAVRTKLDLMAVTQSTSDGNSTTALSFLSQCYGAIADADIGTEHLRWMGSVRFDLGIAYKIFTKAIYPCDLYVKYVTQEKEDLIKLFNKSLEDAKSKPLQNVTPDSFKVSGPHLSELPPNDWIQVASEITSKLSIFYVGKMPIISNDAQFFPAALPNDGSMDLIIIDFNSSIPEITKALLAVEKGRHIDCDSVYHHKIAAYRLVPRLSDSSNHYISIDGENFPVVDTQVEILPGIMTGLLDNGLYVETSLTD